jgi:hypothetical protein
MDLSLMLVVQSGARPAGDFGQPDRARPRGGVPKRAWISTKPFQPEETAILQTDRAAPGRPRVNQRGGVRLKA